MFGPDERYETDFGSLEQSGFTQEFAQDPERLSRFEREAHLLRYPSRFS
jgi:hypothetical protein